MTAEVVGSTINSMWLLVGRAQGRELTPVEREQLERLCGVLRQGIPCRPIYNRAALDLCAVLTSPDFVETESAMEDVRERIEALRHMAG